MDNQYEEKYATAEQFGNRFENMMEEHAQKFTKEVINETYVMDIDEYQQHRKKIQQIVEEEDDL